MFKFRSNPVGGNRSSVPKERWSKLAALVACASLSVTTLIAPALAADNSGSQITTSSSATQDLETDTPQSEVGEVATPVTQEPVVEPVPLVTETPESVSPSPVASEIPAKIQSRELAPAAALVPFASAVTTDIVINVRTVARPAGPLGVPGADYSGTVGATFRLYSNNTTVTPSIIGTALVDSWATCTVAANGTCTIQVPNTGTGGANVGRQFWVVQEQAGANAYFSTALRIGSSSGPVDTGFQPGLTTAMIANTTIQMPRTTAATSDNQASFGAVANSLNNPALSPRCVAGIKVAVVMDLSGSVSTAQRAEFRNALVGTTTAPGLFDALTPSASSVAVFTFGTTSPATGTANYPIPLPLNSAANRTTLNARIATATTGTQYTNWDVALRTVAQANSAQQYDLVLFITDGAPNYMWSGNTTGTDAAAVLGTNVTVRSLEAGIYSANMIKSGNTRVVGVGVGAGVAGGVGANLAAISGPVAGSDYFQTTDWTLLKAQLVSIAAQATCSVPVTVTKQELDGGGGNPTNANGWQVTSQISSVSPGTVAGTPSVANQTTGDTAFQNGLGQAKWSYRFTSPTATATLNISENLNSKPGYRFVGGTCTVTALGGGTRQVQFETDGTVAVSGLVPTDSVNCLIQNKVNTATVEIRKSTNQASSQLFPFTTNLPAGGQFLGTGASSIAGGIQLPDTGSYKVTVPVVTSADTPYKISEDSLPAGWRVDGAPTCRVASAPVGNNTSLVGGVGSVTINRLDAGVELVCTFKNTNAPVPTNAWTASKWASPLSGTATNPAMVIPGTQITYYLFASNKVGGNSPVTDLVLEDDLTDVMISAALPANFGDAGTYVIEDRSLDAPDSSPIQPPVSDQIPASDQGTVSFDPVTKKLTWTVPKLDPDKRLRLAFTVTVFADNYGDPQITNSLTASGSTDPLSCGVGAPCKAFHKTPLPAWSVVKTADPADGNSVDPGTPITYTVTATNSGLIPVQAAVLSDNLSGVIDGGKATLDVASLKWTDDSLGYAAPTFDAGMATISGTVPTLAPGQTVSFEYTVNVAMSSYSSTLTNKVWGTSPTIDPLACTETDPCSTTHTTPAIPKLKLIKQVDAANGGTAVPADWALSARPTFVTSAGPTLSGQGTVAGEIWANTRYTLNETGPAGWIVKTDWSCVNVDPDAATGFDLQIGGYAPGEARLRLYPGADVVCTVVNTDVSAKLTLVKEVAGAGILDDPTDWRLTATPQSIIGQTALSGTTGSVDVTGKLTKIGQYRLSESGGPAGYSASSWSCTGGTIDGDLVTLTSGADVNCKIVNTAIQPKITLVKTVNQNGTGSVSVPTDWNLIAQGPATVQGESGSPEVTAQMVPVGTYDLSEVADSSVDPDGYRLGSLACTDTATGQEILEVTAQDPSVELAFGDDITCTFANIAVGADWTYLKTSNPGTGSTVNPGSVITYTVTVLTGTGINPTNVTLTDDLGQVLTHGTVVDGSISATTGTFVLGSDDKLVWTIPVLQTPSVATLMYQVKVNSTATGVSLKNLVTEESSEPPAACPAENLACRETEHFTPQWELTKVSFPAAGSTVEPGETISYTLTATNTGDVPLVGAIIEDDLADVLDGATLSPGPLPADVTRVGNRLFWAPSAIPVAGTASVSYSVIVDADATGEVLRNVAMATSPIPPEPCKPDNLLCRETTDYTPRWQLTKSSNPASGSTVLPGDIVTYTLTATNTGPVALIDAVAQDDLTDVLSNATLAAPLPLSLQKTGNIVTWDVPDLAIAGQVSVSFSIKVNEGATGVTLRNVVSADSPVPPDPCVASSPLCRETTHMTPQWELTKSSDPVSGSTVMPGDDIVYTLTAKNTGPVLMTGAIVSDDLGEVLDDAELTGTLPTGLVLDADHLTWTVPDIPVGSQVQVSYTVKVGIGERGQTLHNVATASSSLPPQPCPTSNPLCRETLDYTPEWQLTKSADPETGSTVSPGQTITYTLTATNAGPIPLVGVTAQDDLSQVLNNASIDSNTLPAELILAGTTLDWTIPTIPVGESVTISYSVIIDQGANGVTLRNTVTGDQEFPPDSCPASSANCRETEHYTPNWELMKTSDPISGTTVKAGQLVTYTLDVTNTGPVVVQGAIVVDNLERVLDMAELQGSLPAGATLAGSTLTWVVPDIPVGGSAHLSYSVKINSDATEGKLLNVVKAVGNVGSCVTAKDCQTEHPIVSPPIVITPSPLPSQSIPTSQRPTAGSLSVTGLSSAILPIGLVILLAGCSLYFVSRQKRH